MDGLPVTPRPDPAPGRGALERARAHLMDLTPLRVSRDFRSLFIGHTVSFLGDEIIAVVVPYQVYRITGSTFAVGMLGLVTLIPVFVFPIVGGAAADALERRPRDRRLCCGRSTCSRSSRPGCTRSTGRHWIRGRRDSSSRSS